MDILVTGGTGYIGSHTCVELLNKGHNIVIVDNLSNSFEDVISKIEQITNKKVKFIHISICSDIGMQALFASHHFDAVIHFAGLKAVGESVQEPLKYYYNNVYGTITLLKAMKEHNVNKLIFSSSATVYGTPKQVPIKETSDVGGTTNPYGTTKLIIEKILQDYSKANPNSGISILRYFNPVGAHKSGLIGENPIGIPNNLVPYIAQVAMGQRDKLHIFGNDYPTKDGTGIRDYIHITDLANGHIAALEKIEKENGLFIYNLGTGNGYSVFDVLRTYEKVSNKKIPYVIEKRREGDIAECYADASKAKEELNWETKYNLLDMCASSWNYQIKNFEF